MDDGQPTRRPRGLLTRMKYIWTGLGIAIGVALWPIVLPVFILTLIFVCISDAQKQPKPPTKPTRKDP
jgi:hypothetical protein